MSHSLEVADIFRAQGAAWREAHAGHLSLGQLKVMSAIERCRSAELGGHVLCCKNCAQLQIAYNSCRNRHCPKCQATAARRWLEARQMDLLPVEYYHLVFTLPAPISDIAYYNKAVIYHILFKAAAETLRTIPMSTVLFPAGGSPLMVSSGLPANPVSSCLCACCRGCSEGCFSTNLKKLTRSVTCASSPTIATSLIHEPSRTGSSRCAGRSG